LALSSTLQAQHTAAQTTISTLESKERRGEENGEGEEQRGAEWSREEREERRVKRRRGVEWREDTRRSGHGKPSLAPSPTDTAGVAGGHGHCNHHVANRCPHFPRPPLLNFASRDHGIGQMIGLQHPRG
jgi:hypothetical protein